MDGARDLPEIAKAILARFETIPVEEQVYLLKFIDYHGFQKSRLPDDLVNPLIISFGLHAKDLQAEIIEVTTDLSTELHYHQMSVAYIQVLGPREHFPAPKDASVFQGGQWLALQTNDALLIPPKAVHGFTVKPGGHLCFLSLQTPPIEKAGKDDYHKQEEI